MRILAIDPGEKRIGIAISDPEGYLARPLTIINHVSRDKDAINIINFAMENECELILVGQALDIHGMSGYRARSSQKLAERIKSSTEKEVILWDESNTTLRVMEIDLLTKRSRKKRATYKDARAAALLLDDFLSSDIFAAIKKEANAPKEEKK
jgi:putative Holliday junction resolvase